MKIENDIIIIITLIIAVKKVIQKSQHVSVLSMVIIEHWNLKNGGFWTQSHLSTDVWHMAGTESSQKPRDLQKTRNLSVFENWPDQFSYW